MSSTISEIQGHYPPRDAYIGRMASCLSGIGCCEPVGEGVMELKIDFGPEYRVYFGQVGSELVILLNGGDKGSQSRDIKTALQFWVDYRRRHG